MGLFDQFPYTNFHNLNLDWIIGQIKNIKSAVTSTAEDAASASHSAEAAAASAGSAAGSAAYAGNAAALVQQVRDDLDTVNTEMTNFVQAHSGLYNETVLWSGTASATGDTITLSDDIRNYKYIDVQATYKGAVSASAFGTFSSNVVRFTPKMFTDDNAVLNIPYAYNDQLQICTVFMFWDSLDPTDYTKISLGYSRRVSINDHGDLDNAADPGTVIVKIVGVKNIADAEVIDARVGEDDTVYSTLKQRLDTEYSDLKSAIEQGSGLTSAIKSALLQLAQKVAYIDENGQTYYDDLYDALYPPVVYTAITLNTNSLSFGALNTTQTLIATTTPSGGAVTWSSSNTSVATVSQTGVVTSVGYGNATITASCGSLTATCSVAVAQATVTSISATYTQRGDVYADTSLDSLKTDLVVTASWSNGTTSVVASSDYTLSGTLAVVTSTITVSYGGQTTTFNVTVSAKVVDGAYAIWDARDYTTGQTWSDRIGNIALTPTGSPAKANGAVLFDGTEKYFSFGTLSVPTAPGVVCIQCSFKLTDLTKTSFVLCDDVEKGSKVSIAFRPQDGVIRLTTATNAGITITFNYEYTFDTNWHFLTAKLGEDTKIMYIDNTLIDSKTDPNIISIAKRINDSPALHMGAYTYYNGYSNMYLRSLYVYAKSLTDTDIATNYAIESALWE